MSEVTHGYERTSTTTRIKRAIGLSAVGAVIGVPTALGIFTHSTEQAEIAATRVAITPTFDGYITAQNGLLPDIRTAADLPFGIGVSIDVGNTNIPSAASAGQNIGSVAEIYGSVAAQPSGEADKVRDVIIDQAVFSVAAGGAVGSLPAALYYLIGERRRRELHDKKGTKTALALGIIVSTNALAASSSAPVYEQESPGWLPVSEFVAQAVRYPELSSLEIRDNATSGAVRELVRGGINSYTKSSDLYDSFIEDIEQSSDLLHVPLEGERIAIVLSDRHDNIGMDPVHRALADAAGATILINAGDDTSSGQPWEEFSLRSLISAFPANDFVRIGVAGNHDSGGMVREYWEQNGMVVSEEAVQTVEGIDMVIMDDPRQSDYTAAVNEGQRSYAETAERLKEIACDADDKPSLAIVHSASMAESALNAGCVEVVIGGHLHVPVTPQRVDAVDGTVGYTITNSTSGGAAFSFAALGGLRRDAGDTLLTFNEEGRVVGVQQVAFTTKGEYSVGNYEELDYTPNIVRPNLTRDIIASRGKADEASKR